MSDSPKWLEIPWVKEQVRKGLNIAPNKDVKAELKNLQKDVVIAKLRSLDFTWFNKWGTVENGAAHIAIVQTALNLINGNTALDVDGIYKWKWQEGESETQKAIRAFQSSNKWWASIVGDGIPGENTVKKLVAALGGVADTVPPVAAIPELDVNTIPEAPKIQPSLTKLKITQTLKDLWFKAIRNDKGVNDVNPPDGIKWENEKDVTNWNIVLAPGYEVKNWKLVKTPVEVSKSPERTKEQLKTDVIAMLSEIGISWAEIYGNGKPDKNGNIHTKDFSVWKRNFYISINKDWVVFLRDITKDPSNSVKVRVDWTLEWSAEYVSTITQAKATLQVIQSKEKTQTTVPTWLEKYKWKLNIEGNVISKTQELWFEWSTIFIYIENLIPNPKTGKTEEFIRITEANINSGTIPPFLSVKVGWVEGSLIVTPKKNGDALSLDMKFTPKEQPKKTVWSIDTDTRSSVILQSVRSIPGIPANLTSLSQLWFSLDASWNVKLPDGWEWNVEWKSVKIKNGYEVRAWNVVRKPSGWWWTGTKDEA